MTVPRYKKPETKATGVERVTKSQLEGITSGLPLEFTPKYAGAIPTSSAPRTTPIPSQPIQAKPKFTPKPIVRDKTDFVPKYAGAIPESRNVAPSKPVSFDKLGQHKLDVDKRSDPLGQLVRRVEGATNTYTGSFDLPTKARDLGIWLGEKTVKPTTPEQIERSEEFKRMTEDKVKEIKASPEYTEGEAIGYFGPGAFWSKAVGKLPLVNKLAPKAIDTGLKAIIKKGAQIGTQETLAGLGMATTESLARGETFDEGVKRAKDYTLFGGGAGLLLGGAGQGFKQFRQGRQFNQLKNTLKGLPVAEDVAQQYTRQSAPIQKLDDGYKRLSDDLFAPTKSINKNIPTNRIDDVIPPRMDAESSLIRAKQPSDIIPETTPVKKLDDVEIFKSNESILSNAKSGQPVTIRGMRYGQPNKTTTTGDYYGIERSYVNRYSPERLPTDSDVIYKDISFDNPLIINSDIGDGKEMLASRISIDLKSKGKKELASKISGKIDELNQMEWMDARKQVEELDALLKTGAEELGYDGMILKRSTIGTQGSSLFPPANATEIVDFNKIKRTVPETTPIAPTKQPSDVIPEAVNYQSIKSIDQLPTTKEGLEQYVKQVEEAKKQGLEFDMQMFAGAQKKLKEFKIHQPGSATIDRIVPGQQETKKTVKERFKDVYKKWMDDLAPVKEIDEKSYVRATNTKKVGATTEFVINEDLVDAKGKKVGEGLKSSLSDIPKGKEKEFWDYKLHKHNIDRIAEGTPIFPDYSPEQSASMVAMYEKNNPAFATASKRLNKFMERFSNTWLRDTGLIDADALDEMQLMYQNYIPTQREFSQLEKGMKGFNAKSGFVDQGNVVKSATGSGRNVTDPLENIFNYVNRTVRTAKRNMVSQGIVEAVKKNPEKLKKFAELLPENYQGNTDLDNIVFVMNKGKRQFLKVNDLDLLETINGVVSQRHSAPAIVKKSNQIFKELITQKNPVFALRNIARDVPASYIYGSEKNPFKFAKDLKSSFADLAKDTEIAKQYRAVGGSSGNFFSSGKSADYAKEFVNPKTSKNMLVRGAKKTVGGIERFNKITEDVPRFAEFKRILAKTGDVEQALYAAGEISTNFSRGGAYAKAGDQYIPYLNASLQGIDKTVRHAIKNPAGFVGKGLVAITIPTIAQELMNSLVDPEGYEKLNNRTKDAYFVFATGNDKFIKIPKSRELGVLFSSLFQRIYRQATGDKEGFKGFGTTVKTNFGPTDPFQSNLLAPAVFNLRANKDFADRPIVPQYMAMDKRPAYLQFDERTSELAKAIGKVANLSPKQIDYVIRSYTGVIGQFAIPAMTKGASATSPLTRQFTADAAFSNQATRNYYDNLDKLRSDKKEAELNKDTENLPDLNRLAKSINNINSSISKLNEKVREEPDDKKKREIKLEIERIMRKSNEHYKNTDFNELRKLQVDAKKQTK